MKKVVIIAFLIGAMFPLFWLFLALAMFHARGLEKKDVEQRLPAAA